MTNPATPPAAQPDRQPNSSMPNSSMPKSSMPNSSVSMAMLVDLVTNTLDPGYQAAAERRAAQAARGDVAAGRAPRWHQLALAVGCLLVGFVLVVAYVNTHRSAPQAAQVRAKLIERIKTAQHTGKTLDSQAEQLTGQIETQRDRMLGGAAASLRGDVDRAALLAGQTAVVGPGIEVSLADPSPRVTTAPGGRHGTTPIGATQVLTDRDVREVTNELWHDGAEAIAINGIRLTPTSAIRFAGEAVLVDFQPITSPYRVDAIGDANQLLTAFATSEVASREHTISAVNGTSFQIDQRNKLQLPAATGISPRYARPLQSQAGSSGSPSTAPTVPTGPTGPTSESTR